MTSRSKAHRQSKRREDKFLDWGPWEWNFERACWMRKRENANGDVNYQYGESNQSESINQPRQSSAPQQEGLLTASLADIDYSTGENYRYGQGYGPRTNETASNQQWSSYTEPGLPSQNPSQDDPNRETRYLPTGRNERAPSPYLSRPEEAFYNAPTPLPANPGQDSFSESGQMPQPTYNSSFMPAYSPSSSYGPDSQLAEIPPSTDAPFSQSAISNPVPRVAEAYNLTREFASTNLNDQFESPSRMKAPSFNMRSRPEIQSGISNDSFTNQPIAREYEYPNLSPEIRKGDTYPMEGAENNPLVSEEKSENQGRPSKTKSIRIVGEDPKIKVDPLYKEYYIHTSDYFKKGKIFKMLWSEPYGGDTNEEEIGAKGTDELPISSTRYGEQVYSTIRRFVIVKAKKGHCTCVPILTYGKRGTAKPGVKAEYHAIIYAGEKIPVELDGEPKLLKKPVRVVTDQNSERFRSESRVNYSKIYTVEHNVKVAFIGKIHKDSEATFFADFKRVFDE